MLIELNFKMGQMTSELDWESFWRNGKKFLIIIPFQVKIESMIFPALEKFLESIVESSFEG